MTEPEKRLLWINHFAVVPGEGGGTRHFEMSRELVRRGWDVTVAASDVHLQSRTYTRRDGAADRRVIHEDLDGVRFRYLWSAPYERNDWRRAWNWISFARELLRWTPDGGRPDVVIGSSPHLFAALAGWLRARQWGVPFVFEVRDLWPESMTAAGGSKGVVYTGFDRIARWLYAHSDRIVCLARGTMDYLERERSVPRDRLAFVPNGVDPEAFPPVDRDSTGPTTFVYAGAHGPANGLDVVLDAAERLQGRDDIRIQLVGDGPAKADLQADAARRGLTNVEFADPVPKAAMPGVLAAADAGLMVLRQTPLFAFGVSPNKLFDYMGASLPVVCNVPGEVEGMVASAGAGFQAAPGSGEALATAMERIADTPPAQRAAKGAAGRAWVAREHGRTVLAERLDEILRDLVE